MASQARGEVNLDNAVVGLEPMTAKRPRVSAIDKGHLPIILVF
jgi:hypothetical protein